MKQRERLLAAILGLGTLALVSYLALDRLFLAPAAECEMQIQEVDLKINEQLALKARQPAQEAHLRELAAQTFGEDDNRVGQRVRTVITDLVGLSGLSTTQSLRITPGGRAQNAYHEVVCQIQARGKLEPMVNFLFLMAQEPHLHRMDNLVLQPVGGSPGEVTLQVRYATLVLDPAKGEKLVLDAATKTVLDETTLESPERVPYDVIVARDLFRPYMPREPVVAVRPNPVGGGGGSVEPPPTRTSAPPSERVNDLSLYLGQPVVGLTNSDKYYKVGDELAGGKIVCVDYRPMPMPKDPQTLSMSRVIIRIGTDYYAVELGQSLSEKRVLPPAQLPPDLPKLQTVDPGPAPAPGAAAPK
jgi:hypothetical protein